ncbi:MAG TPA: endonuclease/exonuclease/phosphatase family protein [Bacteroidales bacterium]|jgi:endonuclease/exonuclease/phosphatase family metal-dependent hydrolase|nr:endonuclease/exonuclease/phosphatase family protein [Bacteroidales bacterium]HOS72261.1 endonuclease/exonuclease/phosphatase family protein [Bacteroidales bacterium]HQH22700.1 endonuclease/exonuclease/phosphatase family protein [Bacteroidales bacterium]HQJ82084.1 endonuclease/exonuclease/phosphatase family protein [Bacteroidales bacterium]
MKKNKSITVLAVIAAFIIAAGSNTYGQSKKETPFNIITYNIRLNTSSDGENAWPFRKDRVAGLLKFHRADIFNVQEALPEQMDDLVAAFPDFGHVGVGRDDGKREGEHMSVFYSKKRFTKLDDGMFWLSETPEKPGLGWDAACNRTCTWIKLKDNITGKKFLVFNTHLDHRGNKARQEGVRLILERMALINKENLAVIFTGDFNLAKTAAPIQSVLKVLDDARDKSLTQHYGPDGTFTGFPVKANLTGAIDFIFINNKVKVLRHGTLTDSFNLYHPSDHLPVLAEVQID